MKTFQNYQEETCNFIQYSFKIICPRTQLSFVAFTPSIQFVTCLPSDLEFSEEIEVLYINFSDFSYCDN